MTPGMQPHSIAHFPFLLFHSYELAHVHVMLAYATL